MSLILNGIDLPENNLRVICLYPHGAEELVVLDADSGATAGRPIDVIQIPKGHGRLIDGDKLSIEFENQCVGECADCMFEERCVIIDRIAPTILEAEE